jgi:cupin 2 domain-containing protein
MSPKVENLFRDSTGTGREEIIEQLLQAQRLRIERIASHGQPSPEGFWYDQPEQEWVVLLRGSATLALIDAPPLDLKAGDALLIPARCRHRVERTSEDALWLAVHFP